MISPFLFTYISGIFSVICWVYAGAIIRKRRQKPQVRYLAMLIAFAGLWAFSNSWADVSGSNDQILFWSGMAMLTYAFFTAGFFHFTYHFVAEYQKPAKWMLWLVYGLTIIFSVSGFTSLSYYNPVVLYTGPTLVSVGFMAVAGNAFFYLVFLAAYFLLWKNYKKMPPRQRYQSIYIVIGSLGTVIGCVVFTVILPLFGNANFYSTGPVFDAFLIVGISYAIFKHNLLDVKFVIQKSIIYLFLLGIIVVFYLTLLYAAPYFLDNSGSHAVYLIDSLLTAIAGIFGVPPLERRFRKITDRWFYRDAYDYAQALHELSEVLKQNLELEPLKRRTAETLKNFLKSGYVDLRLLEEPAGTGFIGFGVEIKSSGRQIAELRLGEKLSGDPYSQKDLQLLKTFANQAAVALEKTRLFEQVRAHSVMLEEQVNSRAVQLRGAREAQKQMMIDISHSLQTPLTVMKGRLDYLKNRIPGNEEVKILEKTVDEISKRVYDLLRLARLEAREEIFDFRPMNLSGLAGEMVEYLQVLCEAQNIALRSAIEPEIFVQGDRQRLEEMINNIVSNAIKYTGNERVIWVSLRRNGISAELIIQDSGVGINPESLPYVFDRFYREPNSSNAGGMGVGLAIAKKIAEQHKGNISAASVVGKGSTFTVSLPPLVDALKTGIPG